MGRVKERQFGRPEEPTIRRAGPSRNGVPKRPRKQTKYAAPVEEDPLILSEEEEEAEIYDTEMPATLMDTDVLDCPICMKPLSPPVFQCENGHIACSLCCTQLRNKCPSCSCPVGKIRCLAIEKVIGSIKVSCAYEPYGCTETFLYLQKETHEGTCIYTPHKCPGKDCGFHGSSKQLSLHISSKHPNIITNFYFSGVVTKMLGKLDESVVLWEKNHDILFVVSNQIELIGSAISVECLGPSPSSGGFCCELVSKKGASSLKLECDVECVTERKASSSVDFLLVPYYIDDKCENGHIACSLCCTQLRNKCPSCSCPVGKIRCLAIEKVIGSIKVSCAYEPYGCTETFLYLQKETHEGTCIYTPHKCPGKDCGFHGSSKQLSLHISSKHPNIITNFYFSGVVTKMLGKLDESVVLWEKNHDILFVVSNQIELIGSAISVECLGPSPSSGGFCCELVSKKGASSLKLECDVECVTERKASSSVDFLLVPYYIDDKVSLEICIWERS